MKSLIALLLLACVASAKPDATPANPAIARALERREMAPKVRVASQIVADGQVVSTMSDGSTVVAPVKRAVSARLSPSPREAREAQVAALAQRLGTDPANPRAVAAALKKHQDDLNALEIEAAKSKGKSGALGALAGLAAGIAGAKVVGKNLSRNEQDTNN